MYMELETLKNNTPKNNVTTFKNSFDSKKQSQQEKSEMRDMAVSIFQHVPTILQVIRSERRSELHLQEIRNPWLKCFNGKRTCK